jgi:hypothetical protein
MLCGVVQYVLKPTAASQLQQTKCFGPFPLSYPVGKELSLVGLAIQFDVNMPSLTMPTHPHSLTLKG